MGFQTENLSMVGIGVLNDVPNHPDQPPLPDGIHLRWTPGNDRGFPCYGYHLFRRLHKFPQEGFECLNDFSVAALGGQAIFSSLPLGDFGGQAMLTNHGTFTSPNSLVISSGLTTPRGLSLSDRPFIQFYLSPSPAFETSVTLAMPFSTQVVQTSVTLQYKQFGNVVHTQEVELSSGNSETVVFAFDCITGIEISGAQGVILSDLCIKEVHDGWDFGWQEIAGLANPIALPVANTAYPCPNKPTDIRDAQTLALGRITYGGPTPWAAHFSELHEQLGHLTDACPAPSMTDEVISLAADGQNLDDPESLAIDEVKPFDLVMTASLHPAMAQMLGLYFIDTTAEPGQVYDYLIVADHGGELSGVIDDFTSITLRGNAATANRTLDKKTLVTRDQDTQSLNLFDDDIDAWIVFNKTLGDAPAVGVPQNLRGFSLPGITVRDEATGLLQNNGATNVVGLDWQLGLDAENFFHPDRAVMYRIWRNSFGEAQPAFSPPGNTYAPLTPQPVLVARREIDGLAGGTPENFSTSSQFPPFSLHYYDNYVPDGWYAYRLCGIDIFGRYSDYSAPATWYQWAPPPDPRPWYYVDGGGAAQIHAFAVQVIDESAPPPPAAVEAYALDPRDQYVQRDAAWHAWQAGLEASPWYAALDEEERQNLVGLRVRWLWTLYHMRQAPDVHAFRIHYDPDSFIRLEGKVASALEGVNTIQVNSDIDGAYPANHFQGDLLQIGPRYHLVENSQGQPVRFFVRNLGDPIQEGDTLVVKRNFTIASTWQQQLIEIAADSHHEAYVKAITDLAGAELSGHGAGVSGHTLQLPGGTDLSHVRANVEHIELWPAGQAGNSEIRAIDSVDAEDGTLAVATGLPAGWDNLHWRIGLLVHAYEVFLPTAGGVMQNGVPDFAVSLAQPMNYSQVSVNAIRPKPEARKGIVAPPAKIVRTLYDTPPAPVPVPPDSDKVFATPANYQGESFYTHRWRAQPHLKVVLFQALDDALFQVDYDRRVLDPGVVVQADDAQLFPDELPHWSDLRKADVAAEINALNQNAVNAADFATAMQAYQALSNDALRVLAGLPGNEVAFRQINHTPLDPELSSYDNREGPDDPLDVSLAADPDIKAVIHTLPGKARNRYFFREAYIDDARNQGPLGLATVPVYLPDVAPPRAPASVRLIPGENLITVQATLGSDASRLRIYCTADKAAASDVRLMGDALADLALSDLDISNGRISWIHDNLNTASVLYYRLVAVKETEYRGEVIPVASQPSRAVAMKAFDTALPEPPVLAVEWVEQGGGFRAGINWDSEHEVLIQRRRAGVGLWTDLTQWRPPGPTSIQDPFSDPAEGYDYRVLVRKYNGARRVGSLSTLLPMA
jgi:hypothetical protein